MDPQDARFLLRAILFTLALIYVGVQVLEQRRRRRARAADAVPMTRTEEALVSLLLEPGGHDARAVITWADGIYRMETWRRPDVTREAICTGLQVAADDLATRATGERRADRREVLLVVGAGVFWIAEQKVDRHGHAAQILSNVRQQRPLVGRLRRAFLRRRLLRCFFLGHYNPFWLAGR